MLPKKEIQDIQFQIEKGLLGIEQYEFIYLRLIDTIRQLEEQNEALIDENSQLRTERDKLLIESGQRWTKLIKIKNILNE